ncbi:4-coumarate-CoA ligase [Cadophora sp. MPI-SDFR-AT-0126]|nr:4-coumarate-CoA ligase [Leotiomycetes sp. MPI-SDFR-AT-0126]
MPFKSLLPDIDIPKVDLLTYVFPEGSSPSTEPLWRDTKDPSNSLSPAQTMQWVKRLGVGLGKVGLKKGDVVMIFTPNHIFVPVAYLGISGNGYAFSGANPIYTVPEMVYQLKDTQARVLLAYPSLLKTAIQAAKEAGLPKHRVFQFSDKPNQTVDGVKDWREMLGSDEEAKGFSWPKLTPEETTKTVATINYSSGTTGLPKGVCISHKNLISNIEQTMVMKFIHQPFTRETAPPERWLGFLPLYHAYGQLWTIMMALKLQIPVYVVTQFVYEDYLKAIQDFKITELHVAPPILVMLSKRPETTKYDLSSVKTALCGAAPLSRELQTDVSTRFKMRITQGWGMTEVTTGGIAVPFAFDDNTGSVGLLCANTECMLVDDDGKEVGVGERGELWIRGPQVCLRYWRNEEATKNTITPDRWLKTGDVAVCDERGYFWIVDRKKELIKVNGLQVSPAELEAALLEHQDIADAAVVGVILHDEERPRAYVAIQDSAKGKIRPEDIQEWIKPRVAKHKHLAGGVSFVNEVPKLASGKIQRKVMREWAKRDAEILQKEIKARF